MSISLVLQMFNTLMHANVRRFGWLGCFPRAEAAGRDGPHAGSPACQRSVLREHPRDCFLQHRHPAAICRYRHTLQQQGKHLLVKN